MRKKVLISTWYLSISVDGHRLFLYNKFWSDRLPCSMREWCFLSGWLPNDWGILFVSFRCSCCPPKIWNIVSLRILSIVVWTKHNKKKPKVEQLNNLYLDVNQVQLWLSVWLILFCSYSLTMIAFFFWIEIRGFMIVKFIKKNNTFDIWENNWL
jgi:hypothetical protein